MSEWFRDGKIDALGPFEAAERYEPPPDWAPAERGYCTCGHYWMFHAIRGPHKCNECKSCIGYVAAEEVVR